MRAILSDVEENSMPDSSESNLRVESKEENLSGVSLKQVRSVFSYTDAKNSSAVVGAMMNFKGSSIHLGSATNLLLTFLFARYLLSLSVPSPPVVDVELT